jgi:hypothetical protein
MGNTKAPRRKYRPKPVMLDTMKLAVRRARKVPADEIAAVMAPLRDSFRALREGVASEGQWNLLASSVELALAIERQGVVRRLRGHLTAAEAALAGIKHRAMDSGSWKPTALYYQEIEAIDTFIWLHEHQLENLSEGEWRKAADQAEAVVRSAGGQVVDIRELQGEQVPLQLLGGAQA